MFTTMGTFVFSACVSTFVPIALSTLVAMAVSALAGIDLRTMVLATAPDSVTEMALTARLLHEGVAMVTAFHLVRIFTILPLAPLIVTTAARVAS